MRKIVTLLLLPVLLSAQLPGRVTWEDSYSTIISKIETMCSDYDYEYHTETNIGVVIRVQPAWTPDHGVWTTFEFKIHNSKLWAVEEKINIRYLNEYVRVMTSPANGRYISYKDSGSAYFIWEYDSYTTTLWYKEGANFFNIQHKKS